MSEFKTQINQLTTEDKSYIQSGKYTIARFFREPSHTYQVFKLNDINEIKDLKINKNAIILVGDQAYLVENKKLALDENKKPKRARIFLSPDEEDYLLNKSGEINKDDNAIDPPIDWDGIIGEQRISMGIAPEDYAYYAFDSTNVLGEGAFGKVCEGYSLKYPSGEIDKEKPIVGKFIQANKFDYQESKRIHGYFLTHDAIAVNDKMLLPMERLPGQDLQKFIESGKLSTLSAEQRIDLALQIMLSLNVIHHETGRTGSALIHGDIKPDNIQISMDKNGRVNGYVLDFGLSSEIEDETEIINKSSGTAIYVAPEVPMKAEMTIASDIFSLGLVMASLLGSDQEINQFFDERWKNYQQYDQTKNEWFFLNFANMNPAPYLANSLNDQEFPKFHSNVKKDTHLFLSRMLHQNPEDRPNTDECLRFFTTLSALSHLQARLEKSTNANERNELMNSLNANEFKLMILASSDFTWDQKNDCLQKFDFSAYKKELREQIQSKNPVEIRALYKNIAENLTSVPEEIHNKLVDMVNNPNENKFLSLSDVEQIYSNSKQVLFLFEEKFIQSEIGRSNAAFKLFSPELKSRLIDPDADHTLMNRDELINLIKEVIQYETQITQLFGKEAYQNLGESLMEKITVLNLSSSELNLINRLINLNKADHVLMNRDELTDLTKKSREYKSDIIGLFGEEAYQNLGKSLVKEITALNLFSPELIKKLENPNSHRKLIDRDELADLIKEVREYKSDIIGLFGEEAYQNLGKSLVCEITALKLFSSKLIERLANPDEDRKPINIDQLVKLTKEARECKSEITQLFGEEAYQDLGKSLLKEYVKYKQILSGTHERSWFGYTHQEKLQAGKALLHVIESEGKFEDLDTKTKKILNQGRLHQLTKPLIKNLDNAPEQKNNTLKR